MNCQNLSVMALWMAVSLLSGCAGASAGIASQTGFVADRDSPSEGDGPVMRTAHAILAGKQGEENSDAAALRAAAQILQAIGARPDGNQDEDLSKRWGERAQALDPSTRPPVYRGRALGPSYRKGKVSAKSGVSTDQIFLAGKKASVALVPVSSKPLSIKIIDPQGKDICRQNVSSKPANCEWLPLFTERYRINIHTSATQPVAYYLISN